MAETCDAGAAWAGRAAELAVWAMARLVNRSDRCGGYWTDKDETTGEPVVRKTTRPAKAGKPGFVTARRVAKHFIAARPEDVIGFHSLGPASVGRWLGVDLDLHDGDAAADPAANLAYALHLYAVLTGLGFRVLLYASNGRGGYHLLVFFDEPVPGALLHAFGRWLVRDHAAHGVGQRPETYPKQPRVAGEGGPGPAWGNWLRLIGRHYKRDFWPGVFDGQNWVDGEAAVGHVLSFDGQSPGLIPADAYPAPPAEPAPAAGRAPRTRGGPPVDGDDGRQPGDVFDDNADWPAMLADDGARKERDRGDGASEWVRPGKDAVSGATLGFRKNRRGVPLLYVFTDKWPHLEQNRFYTPMQFATAKRFGRVDPGTIGQMASELIRTGVIKMPDGPNRRRLYRGATCSGRVGDTVISPAPWETAEPRSDNPRPDSHNQEAPTDKSGQPSDNPGPKSDEPKAAGDDDAGGVPPDPPPDDRPPPLPPGPVVIVVGERDTDAGLVHGLPCVGVDGPWGWRDGADGGMIPDLAGVDWSDREVTVCYPSDCVEDAGLQAAAFQLSRALVAAVPPPADGGPVSGGDDEPDHRPTVRQVHLPCGPDGARLTLADYLRTHGRPGWDELARVASPVAMPDQPHHLTNTIRVMDADGEVGEVPRQPEHIVRRMLSVTRGWPKRADHVLFAEGRDHRPLWLGKDSTLFAGLHTLVGERSGAATSRIEWVDRARGVTSKKEFFGFCQARVPHVDGVELFPLHAPVPGLNLHFMHPPLPPRDGTALRSLLDRFSPASPEDRSLVLAFFLTLVWGGPAGARPCFLFTTPDGTAAGGRGSGKSTVAKIAGRLFESKYLGLTDKDNINAMKTRIVSPSADGAKILLLDNLKSLRFSWDDMEAMVTSDIISGHRLYHGNHQRPNLFTVVMTMNGASLSRDFAQRTIVVQLNRAKYTASWEREIHHLVDTRRWEIIADLIDCFAYPAATLTRFGRWATWEADVIARLKEPEAVQQTVAERQAKYDADDDEAEHFHDAIAAYLSQHGLSANGDQVRFSAPEITVALNQGLGMKWDVMRVTQKLATMDVPGLEKRKIGSVRFYEWTGGDWVSADRWKWFSDHKNAVPTW